MIHRTLDSCDGTSRTRRLWISGVLLGAAFLAVATSWAADPPPASEATSMVDDGSWYSRVQWPHDGDPFESRNFAVFSDAAGQEAKRTVAALGEEVLAELIAEFDIDAERMFRFPPDQEKIHIYVYQNRYPRSWGARAYHAGLVIWSPNHRQRDTDRVRYRSTFKHELVHVVEALLKGRDVINMPVDTRVQVWFSEGFAEASKSETTRETIRDLGHLNHLITRYGRFNPVSFVHDGQAMEWSKGKPAMVGYEYHYPMYRLAVEYLMDPVGLGIRRPDLVCIFTDMADGADFSTAFENRTGIALADYEEQFFDRMNGFLDEDGTVPYRRAALVWLVLVASSLIVLVRALSRSPETRGNAVATWLPVTVLYGPLGWLGYRSSRRDPGGRTSNRKRALEISMSRVTWIVAGLSLVVSLFANLGNGDVDPRPRNLVIPLLFGWLILFSLSMAVRSRSSNRISIRRKLPAEFLILILALAGVLAVLTPLDRYWWFTLDPRALLSWSLLPAGAIGGTILVYPYLAWRIDRNSARVS